MSSESPKEGNNFDEIPLARRLGASRRITSTRFRYFLLGSVFLTLFTVFVSFNLIPKQDILLFSSKRNVKTKISKDGLLLGHFPYKEASKDNLRSVYPGMEVHKSVLKDLVKMRAAAASQGIQLIVISGFRSIDLQQLLGRTYQDVPSSSHSES